MTQPTTGRIALVTGGRRGLGRAIVDELLERGAAKVYATARSPFEHPDPRVVALVLDVTDHASVRAAADSAGDVDLLVNNAGVFTPSPVLSGDEDALRDNLETNLFGLLGVTRAFAPVLEQHGRSTVLNVLSVVSWKAAFGGYGVSKSAALSASNAIRIELAEQGTDVSSLFVGFMDTDMIGDMDVEKADPAAIARAAADGIERGDWEILADDAARQIKAALSEDASALYPELTGAA